MQLLQHKKSNRRIYEKNIFSVTLLVAIVIPSLAFFDKDMDKTKIANFAPTENARIPSAKKYNPIFKIEYNDMKSVPISTIDDRWGNSIELDMEFQECG
jgi:hypothetical protein